MGISNRKKQLLKLENKQLESINYGNLAEAIHQTVCRITGGNGYKDCLTYSILGTEWLNRNTDTNHTILGGKLLGNYYGTQVLFEHFWCGRMVRGKNIYVDFGCRYNSDLFSQKDPDHNSLFPTLNYYVGDGLDITYWKYLVLKETTKFAVKTFLESSKDGVHLVDQFLSELNSKTG